MQYIQCVQGTVYNASLMNNTSVQYQCTQVQYNTLSIRQTLDTMTHTRHSTLQYVYSIYSIHSIQYTIYTVYTARAVLHMHTVMSTQSQGACVQETQCQTSSTARDSRVQTESIAPSFPSSPVSFPSLSVIHPTVLPRPPQTCSPETKLFTIDDIQ